MQGKIIVQIYFRNGSFWAKPTWLANGLTISFRHLHLHLTFEIKWVLSSGTQLMFFCIGSEAIIIHMETWLCLILIQVAPQSNTWAHKSMSRESGLQSTAMLSWYSFLCPDLCYHWFSQTLTKS